MEFILIFGIIAIIWIMVRIFKKEDQQKDQTSVSIKLPDHIPYQDKPSIEPEEEEKSAPCPHCGVVLEPKPKRKKKCPHCGEHIYIRQGKLYTEEGIKGWEKDLQQLREQQQRRGFLLGLAATFGIDEREFEILKANLLKKYGMQVNDELVVKEIFSELTTLDMEIHDKQTIYYHYARFEYFIGGQHIEYLKTAHKYKLLQIKDAGIEKVEIVTGGSLCDHRMKGRILKVDEALKEMPIPCNNPEFCMCRYVSVVE